MWRVGAIVFLWCLVLLGGMAVFTYGTSASAPPVGVRQSEGVSVPLTACTYTSLSFTLQGLGTIDDRRPFTMTTADTFVLFPPAQPIAATAASNGSVLMNNSFSGGALGGITGTFVISNLNGIAVTGSTLTDEARGYQVSKISIRDGGGRIDGILAVNFAATTAVPPYYPRGLQGYIFSTTTTRTYAPYRFYGTVSGMMGLPSGSNVPINATVTGRLYSGGSSASLLSNGSRVLPVGRALALFSSDQVTQFIQPDFAAGTGLGRFDPDRTFLGNMTLSGLPATVTGTFYLRHNSLLMDNGTINDRGWIVGNYQGASGADTISGVWLGDLPDVSLHGYLLQVGGTGQFASSLLVEQYAGAIAYNGGTDIAVGGSGLYCSDMLPLGITPTSTSTATSTSTPSHTFTPSATPTQTATLTPPTDTPTGTASPTASMTATRTNMATSTSTSTATATPGNCSALFSDVQPSDYFYQAVSYLYCHGVVSGYNDGTFRPYANTTRGQLSKIAVLSEQWPIVTPTGTPTFRDVPAGSPFYAYVETAYSHNIISGYSCGAGCLEFRPGNNITRAQLTKVIVLAQGWAITPPGTPTFRDVPASDPFFGYVETAYAHGIISGYSCGTGCLEFRPGADATRGQLAKIVYQAISP